MNPEYVVLGGLDWRLMGKKIFFWYNHPKNDWRLRIATALAHSVFYTSPYAATAKLKKAIRMPAGIDTELFSPQSVPRDRHALYMQGRIMPSKHVEIALEALRLVRKNGTPATLTLVGPEDVAYGTKLRQEFADLVNSNAVTFAGSKPNEKTPALYSAHGVSINLAGDGHYDKSVLESLACETSVVLSSHAFNEKGVAIAPNMFLFKESTPKALSEMVLFVLRDLIGLDELVSRGRDVVIARESLVMLTNKLVKEITP
jgi:glycosyltransferase involved in cell wall biosynthesis